MAPMLDRRGREVPVHNLRPNEKVWTPPSVIFLDAETRWADIGPDQLHRLRLWVACHVDRRQVRKKAGPVTWGWGDTPDGFAGWLDGRTRGRDCIWVYAHNLNFDLVTLALSDTMTARGWALNEFSVSSGAPWLRFGRGGRTITVCDSWSWLPMALESMATLSGGRKERLPDNADPEGDWIRRCGADVDIMARSVLGLMDWWDERRLGRWTISGAGSGWNAFRHRPSPVRHVIDPDPELVAQDRRAVRGGRKDAAVVRSGGGGPWVEIDLEAAYPTVARDLPLPTKRAWTFDALPVDSPWIGSKNYGVIAECVVSTDRPRYPVRHDGVTWYPVGTFTTTLAGPELVWARESGHLVSVGAGQAHRLGSALRPWAAWVLDPSEGGTVPTPPVALKACKVWGRSVIGKFAARGHSTTELEGPAPPGWGITDCWDGRVGRRGAEVRMGGRAMLVTYDLDTENCYPAVLAWVESEVRVRLGRVLEALDGAWWTADTDGLLLDITHLFGWLELGGIRLGDRPRDPIGLAQAVCDQLAPVVAPLRLRPKRCYESLSVLGPQHQVRDGVAKMSGVRAAAAEVEPMRFVARDWPGLKWQMQHSTPGTYRRPERTSTFAAPTVHRWVMVDGSTRPVEFARGVDGANVLVPWSRSRWSGGAVGLADVQYRKLQRVAL